MPYKETIPETAIEGVRQLRHPSEDVHCRPRNPSPLNFRPKLINKRKALIFTEKIPDMAARCINSRFVITA
jgi:hypothetical protein